MAIERHDPGSAPRPLPGSAGGSLAWLAIGRSQVPGPRPLQPPGPGGPSLGSSSKSLMTG